MPDPSYLVVAVAVASAVTWSLRAVPFAVLTRLRASPAVSYLSARMPLGVMVILLVYSLRDLPLASPAAAGPDLGALAVTAGLHLWRRNAVLSILAGTALHIALLLAFPPG
ncbi:MAG: branched-chain amino acid transporter permease [Streptosporangiaceae bacterium]